MANESTGKARGRPKTKEYVTMLARVPAELADLVKRYAAQHGNIPVSELIREGLEWRVGDGDPRGTGLYLAQPTGIREEEYSSNTGKAQGDEVLQEVRALLARQWEQIQTLAQALERERVSASDGVYSSNTKKAPSVVQDVMVPRVKVDKEEVLVRIQQMRDKGLDSTQIAKELQAEGVPTLSGDAQLQAVVDMLEPRAEQDCSEGNTRNTAIEREEQVSTSEQEPARGTVPMDTIPPVQATVLQAAQNPALASVEAPSFDTTRYYLGKLCPKRHEWGGTGMSLLRKHKQSCRDCDNESKRAQRQAKRQEVSV
jgi:hypothetical protein